MWAGEGKWLEDRPAAIQNHGAFLASDGAAEMRRSA